MSYTIDASWHPHDSLYGRHRPGKNALEATIVLVGCGGTGGFLATSIARLLIGRRARLFLVDYDRVEPSNLGRQAFSAEDLGKFKAEVLAHRIARDFGITVSYSTLPYNESVHRDAFEEEPDERLALIVGAVDNAAARRGIAATLQAPNSGLFWLDLGNGFNHGQVLLGNILLADRLKGTFDPDTLLCYALPAPNLQQPELLLSPPQPDADPLNCAVAVERAEQSASINQTMAAVGASYIEHLLNGTCQWMASYVDMQNGTLSTIPADPNKVARVVDKPTRFLVRRTPHQVKVAA